MFVCICRVELKIYESGSLKEKRSVLRSLLSKLRNLGTVSVSEVAHHDKWQRTALGLATVSKDSINAEKGIAQAIDLIEREYRVEILHIDQIVESYDNEKE